MPSADPPTGIERQEARLAWGLVLPALLTILLVALFPLGWTVWESLHLHDLRMPSGSCTQLPVGRVGNFNTLVTRLYTFDTL